MLINQYIFFFFFQPATFQLPNHSGGVNPSSLGGQPMGGNMTPNMGTPTKDHKFSDMDGMMVFS